MSIDNRPPWRDLDELDTEDLDILMDSLNAAQSKLSRAHPEEQEMWHELMDLLDDMHQSWNVAFLRKQLATKPIVTR